MTFARVAILPIGTAVIFAADTLTDYEIAVAVFYSAVVCRGIPADQIEQIFDALITTKAEGMGTGLAISRSIVEAHGGRIWVSPDPAGGVAFHVTLPERGLGGA